MFIQMLFIRNTTVYEKTSRDRACLYKDFSKIRCIVLCVLQTLKRFWVFLFHHSSEGGANANHTVMCSPSLAENDSRVLKNREGNHNGEWIFLSKEGGRCCFILAKISKIHEANLTS